MAVHDDPRGPLEPGDRFLKFEIRALIGRGGHARVYHGFDRFLGRDVAIKLLHRQGGVTADMLRRGQAEAQLLTRLRHPNIVEVIDAGMTDGGDLYIVMELLRGRSLRDVLRDHNHLRIDEVLGILAAVADGVEAAHHEKAIHRDLKPENIFVTADNRPKVLDFGVAKMVGSPAWTTQKDIVLGTMLYMSPEQLQGFRVTPRTDVYALGVIAYEALLGKHPCLLKNTDMTVQELAWVQATQMPPLLSELDKGIPQYVARVVNRAITKLPDQRFGTMQDLAAALRETSSRYTQEQRRAGRALVSRDLSISLEPPSALEATPAPNAALDELDNPNLRDTESQSSPGFPIRTPSGQSVPSVAHTEPLGSRENEDLNRRIQKAVNQNTPAPVSAHVEGLPNSRKRRRSSRRAQVHRVVGAGVLVGSVLGGAWTLLFKQPHLAEPASTGGATSIQPPVPLAPVMAPAQSATVAEPATSATAESPAPKAAEVAVAVDAPPAPKSEQAAPAARPSSVGPSIVKATPRTPSPSHSVAAVALNPPTDTDNMGERLRWLERDLKGDAPPMPGSGLDAHGRPKPAGVAGSTSPAPSSGSTASGKSWIR